MTRAFVLFTSAWVLAIQAGAVGMGLVGLHFFPSAIPLNAGWCLLAVGAPIFAYAAWRGRRALWPTAALAVASAPAALAITALCTLGAPRGLAQRYQDHFRATHAVPMGATEVDAGALLFTGPDVQREDTSGALVILLHGAGNDRLYGFWSLIDALVQSGHEVLTAHLPGHGQGGTDTFSLAASRARVDALVKAARRLRPVGSVVLVGQSLGGSLALDSVARGVPVDAVVSISAPAHLDEDNLSFLAEARSFLRPALYQALRYGRIAEVLPAVGSFRRETFPIRLDGNDGNDGTEGLYYFAAFARAVAGMNLLNRLANQETHCPVLLVHGQSDGVVPVQQAEQLATASRGTLSVFRGVTHADATLDAAVLEHVVAWVGSAPYLRADPSIGVAVVSQ